MFSLNKRFLMAPVIALAALAMAAPEALSGGHPNRPVHHPATSGGTGGGVHHPAPGRKPTPHPPTTTRKPPAGAYHPKASPGSKGKPPSASTKPKGGAELPKKRKGGSATPAGSKGGPGSAKDSTSIGGDVGNGNTIDSNNTTVNNYGPGWGAWGFGQWSNWGPIPHVGGDTWGSWPSWGAFPPAASGVVPSVSAGSMPPSVSVQEANPADVIKAGGDYDKSVAEADAERERTRKEKIENDRRYREIKRSERESAPSPEQERQRTKMEEVRRALNPPAQDIYSAKAPNLLLDDLKGYPGLYQGQGPEVPLDVDCLRQINVVSGQDTGNIGLLKKELSWPVALQGAEHKEPREALNGLVPQAIKQAVQGSVEADTLREMKVALGRLNTRLAGSIDKLSTPRHIEAKRFLGQLDEALKVLAKPHAGEYFSGKFSAKGKTVADLVRHMSKEGLKFAPAVGGEETAYEGLHKALVAYDVAAHNSAAHSSMTQKE